MDSVNKYYCYYIWLYSICYFGISAMGIILGAILLDLGVKCCNVSNKTGIHKLSEQACNRVTSVYM